MAEHDAAVVAGADVQRRRPRWTDRPWYDHVPWFFYILVVYVAGALVLNDARAPWFNLDGFSLSWAELLPVLAALAAMAELRRVAQAGVDNIGECLEMLMITGVQLVLFVLALAQVRWAILFKTTEFLFLLLISAGQTASAFIINAQTLKRTITSG